MQITIEIPDEIMLELNQTNSSIQEFVMQAIQKYTYRGDRLLLLQTETWKLCGGLRVNKEVEIVTNYAETIDDVLYGNL